MSPVVRFVISSITFGLLSLAVMAGADTQFKPGAAASYSHQSAGPVTIGAKPYNNSELLARLKYSWAGCSQVKPRPP